MKNDQQWETKEQQKVCTTNSKCNKQGKRNERHAKVKDKGKGNSGMALIDKLRGILPH